MEIKNGGNNPVNNLKKLSKYVPCSHFKMEEIFILDEMLLPGALIRKTYLKEAYFSVPQSGKSQMFY